MSTTLVGLGDSQGKSAGELSAEMQQYINSAQKKDVWLSTNINTALVDGSSETLPFPFTVEHVQQASMELSPGAQVALESCIGAWKVNFQIKYSICLKWLNLIN